MLRILVVVLGIGYWPALWAQQDPNEEPKFAFSGALQLWSTYTLEQDVSEGHSFVPVENRLNFQLRRSRFSLKGKPMDRMQFEFTTALDLVGRDVLSATQGGANNGLSVPAIWNAYIQYEVHPWVFVATGYMVPQIGRASITGAMASNSFEKSWSQNYLRKHLVGTGPGRAMGLNIGGLIPLQASILLRYDLGVFSPQAFDLEGNSQGKDPAPLWIARVGVQIGDPEATTYGLGHSIHHFGRRNGVTVSVSAARTGQTDNWLSNELIGFDFLWNKHHLNLSGEWSWHLRTNEVKKMSSAHSGFVRMGYLIKIFGDNLLEPVCMLTEYFGALKAEEQTRAHSLGMYSGQDSVFEFGLNYYIGSKVKLSFFYTSNHGYAGELSPHNNRINNHFYQTGVGTIQRGDVLGMGWVTKF